MTGIPRFVAKHELETYPHVEPRVQRKRSIAPDRRKVVKKAGIVKKDIYPLLEIDGKIESLMRLKYKCFLDAYKGYHQIQMAKKDKENTTFHTDEGVFCYTKMPFEIKNVGAMYQRLVDTMFEGQMRRNLEAYVDDMVIKKLPTLTVLKKEEKLMVYLSAVNEAVSDVLLVEREGRQAQSIMFKSSNNEGQKMHAFVDSKLVANQVEGLYEAKGKKTKKYKEKALEMIRSFNDFKISHIPREENRKVDALSKLVAVQCEGLTKGVLIEELNERLVDMAEVNAIIEKATRAWITPIQYIKKKILPEDATEA
nr:hypothetical protein [Tanacetum cinerariifolium]